MSISRLVYHTSVSAGLAVNPVAIDHFRDDRDLRRRRLYTCYMTRRIIMYVTLQG